jgi:hypothetical protein
MGGRARGGRTASAAGGALVLGLVLAASALLIRPVPAEAAPEQAKGIPPASEICRPQGAPDVRRRRPGQSDTPVIEYALPPCDPDRIRPFTGMMELGPAVPDRWRIVQALGYEEQIWDPYAAHNPLKGDLPVWGEDWFFSILAINDIIIEPRRFPLPVGIATTARPGAQDLIGQGESTVMVETFLPEIVIYKGNTTFKPPDWEFRFTPAFNYNQVHFDQRGVAKVQPGGADISGRVRKEGHVGIQALFIDKHLWNVSDRYDFDSLRVGIQPITADFRGFLFLDQQLGIRLFGTRDNNIFQYNVAWFQRIEKDTNTQLNNHGEDLRDDHVFLANLYWQDFPTKGHTSQVAIVHNRNREKGQVHFDDNGFIARPSSLFQERFARDYDVTYLGFNGDGHFDRWNLSTSFYWAVGTQTNDRFRGAEDEISAQFFAAELSHDWDWTRWRLSALWASGDDDPFDDEAKGFDAIFENPQFAGADTSFWIRQPVPLIGGGAVSISGRNGVLNSLRSTKENGQSNFVNPGTMLFGIGGDFDITPETRVSFNAHHLWFEDSAVVEAVRNQGDIDRSIGTDLSLSLIWRPFMSQNIVVRLSAATLIPGEGFKDLFGRDEPDPYSVLANIVLQY